MRRNSSCNLLKKSKCVGRSLAFCMDLSDASDFSLLLASVKKRPRTKPCTFLRLVRGLRPSEKGFSDKADGVLIKLNRDRLIRMGLHFENTVRRNVGALGAMNRGYFMSAQIQAKQTTPFGINLDLLPMP